MNIEYKYNINTVRFFFFGISSNHLLALYTLNKSPTAELVLKIQNKRVLKHVI